jgi:hypothetical protein
MQRVAMKSLVVYLTLGVFPVLAGSWQAPTVRLYTQFQQGPPETVLESIQEELDNILEPLGLEFEWRSLALTQGSEVSTELAVIHFKGNCDISDLEAADAFPGPLGWTHMSDGEILPFSDVNCDGIRLFLQRDLLNLPEKDRPAAYGRAIARVVAHELYHIFAKTTKHGARGLGKAAYSAQELLRTRFQFEKRESEVLRAHHLRLVGASDNAGR